MTGKVKKKKINFEVKKFHTQKAKNGMLLSVSLKAHSDDRALSGMHDICNQATGWLIVTRLFYGLIELRKLVVFPKNYCSVVKMQRDFCFVFWKIPISWNDDWVVRLTLLLLLDKGLLCQARRDIRVNLFFVFLTEVISIHWCRKQARLFFFFLKTSFQKQQYIFILFGNEIKAS